MDGYKQLSLFLLCLVIAPLSAQEKTEEKPPEHKLVPAIKIARQSLEAAKQIEDFTATFFKREIVNGKVVIHSMSMKYRQTPFSAYLRFNKPNEGREVIYVEGQNDGNLLAHETGIKGIVGTISLHPTSKEAMSESKQPITELGLHKLAEQMIKQWEFESKYGECELKYYPEAKLGELKCLVIESSHPVPRRQFPYHMTRFFIDKATKIPVRIEHYGFPSKQGEKPPLMEEYTYSNIKPNVGLSDIDFDPRNPNYNF
ncbi:MAG TPA: DUF1571 domain-containing protein [Planctomycetaceae bacterium]|nr:DUF1571 domain-containing protein [Planctomycetaceae bacterium]